jgi:hypothetical protein
MTMKLLALPILIAAALTANLPAAAPAAINPVVAAVAVEGLEPTSSGSCSVRTESLARCFAGYLASQGYCAVVFFNPNSGWWVCMWF